MKYLTAEEIIKKYYPEDGSAHCMDKSSLQTILTELSAEKVSDIVREYYPEDGAAPRMNKVALQNILEKYPPIKLSEKYSTGDGSDSLINNTLSENPALSDYLLEQFIQNLVGLPSNNDLLSSTNNTALKNSFYSLKNESEYQLLLKDEDFLKKIRDQKTAPPCMTYFFSTLYEKFAMSHSNEEKIRDKNPKLFYLTYTVNHFFLRLIPTFIIGRIDIAGTDIPIAHGFVAQIIHPLQKWINEISTPPEQKQTHSIILKYETQLMAFLNFLTCFDDKQKNNNHSNITIPQNKISIIDNNNNNNAPVISAQKKRVSFPSLNKGEELLANEIFQIHDKTLDLTPDRTNIFIEHMRAQWKNHPELLAPFEKAVTDFQKKESQFVEDPTDILFRFIQSSDQEATEKFFVFLDFLRGKEYTGNMTTVNFKKKNGRGDTLLEATTRNSSVGHILVNTLLKNCPNPEDFATFELLEKVVEQKNIKTYSRLLIAFPTLPQKKDAEGNNILHKLAKKNPFTLEEKMFIELLVNSSPQLLEEKNNSGITPLQLNLSLKPFLKILPSSEGNHSLPNRNILPKSQSFFPSSSTNHTPTVSMYPTTSSHRSRRSQKDLPLISEPRFVSSTHEGLLPAPNTSRVQLPPKHHSALPGKSRNSWDNDAKPNTFSRASVLTKLKIKKQPKEEEPLNTTPPDSLPISVGNYDESGTATPANEPNETTFPNGTNTKPPLADVDLSIALIENTHKLTGPKK